MVWYQVILYLECVQYTVGNQCMYLWCYKQFIPCHAYSCDNHTAFHCMDDLQVFRSLYKCLNWVVFSEGSHKSDCLSLGDIAQRDSAELQVFCHTLWHLHGTGKYDCILQEQQLEARYNILACSLCLSWCFHKHYYITALFGSYTDGGLTDQLLLLWWCL